MQSFTALVIRRDDQEAPQQVAIENLSASELMDGEVDVRVEHSTVNYKDGLAITGKLPVVRRFPMIPGIDLAGTVVRSDDARYAEGQRVILNGWGAGETHLGGYSQLARLKGDWLLPLPDGLSGAEAMAVGTAGYTAMLAVLALEDHGVSPEAGPVVVTGAAGGVGSMAVTFLAVAGYEVEAVTGRAEAADYLTSLGASAVVARDELTGKPRMLGKERWAAGIDAVGSNVLANVLSTIRRGGAVAACGNAGGMDLPTSVAPFILRGVSLLGIDSVMAPRALRERAWQRIVGDLDRRKLADMTETVPLHDVVQVARDIVEGRVRGRVVVELP